MLLLGPSAGGPVDNREGTALVDTGSTTSGIRTSLARALQLQPRGKRPMSGIGGEQQIERYIFRIGLLGSGLPYIFDDLIGFELRESFAFDALIGMDLLRQCDMTIGRDGRVVLELL